MPTLTTDIRVAVIFGPGNSFRPIWFDLQGRRHNVLSITNRWQARRGEIVFFHFQVTDDLALFELIYHAQNATWQLLRIEAL